MKKGILITGILLCSLIPLSGCSATENETFIGPPNPVKRIAEGNHLTSGLILTDDGHLWAYDNPTESITQNHRVVICFDKNGTEHDLKDDNVLKIVPLKSQKQN